MAIQIFGGMGFVEETGIAQYMRDARITPIYEGTTAIQAADLAGRKIARDGGQVLVSLIQEMRADRNLAGPATRSSRPSPPTWARASTTWRPPPARCWRR
jgi:hypothetical protein